MTNDEFKNRAYEIAFGDDAINKGYSDQEVIDKLLEFSNKALDADDDVGDGGLTNVRCSEEDEYRIYAANRDLPIGQMFADLLGESVARDNARYLVKSWNYHVHLVLMLGHAREYLDHPEVKKIDFVLNSACMVECIDTLLKQMGEV